MELLEVLPNNFHQVAQLKVSKVEDNYSDVFDGWLGQLPGVQHLQVESDVKPVVMADRRIPQAVRPLLKTELEHLVKEGVITPVKNPPHGLLESDRSSKEENWRTSHLPGPPCFEQSPQRRTRHPTCA